MNKTDKIKIFIEYDNGKEDEQQYEENVDIKTLTFKERVRPLSNRMQMTIQDKVTMGQLFLIMKEI